MIVKTTRRTIPADLAIFVRTPSFRGRVRIERFTNQLAEKHTADLELQYKFGAAESTELAVRNAYYASPNY